MKTSKTTKGIVISIARYGKEMVNAREKQTGWKRHEWGVVGDTPNHMQEIAQCQVPSCGTFKVNDNRPYLTYKQLVKQYPNIRWY